MIIRRYFPTAAADVAAIARGAAATPLTAPTPCAEFDLRTLINHFIGTTDALARVGRRHALNPDDPYGARNDATAGDWPAALASNLSELAAVWSAEPTWNGAVDMGGNELPAVLIGEMSMAEVLLHGWDLAAATGQRLSVPDDAASELLRHITDTAEWGRSMGAYGPVVVDAAAARGPFGRALATAGRAPRWTPNGAAACAAC